MGICKDDTYEFRLFEEQLEIVGRYLSDLEEKVEEQEFDISELKDTITALENQDNWNEESDMELAHYGRY